MYKDIDLNDENFVNGNDISTIEDIDSIEQSIRNCISIAYKENLADLEFGLDIDHHLDQIETKQNLDLLEDDIKDAIKRSDDRIKIKDVEFSSNNINALAVRISYTTDIFKNQIQFVVVRVF